MLGLKIPKQHRKKITRVLSKFFYYKLCFDRVYGGYVGTFIDMFRDLTLITAGMTILFPTVKIWMVVPVFILALIAWITLGKIDIKNKFAHLENSIRNQINPELMTIHKEIQGINKKLARMKGGK